MAQHGRLPSFASTFSEVPRINQAPSLPAIQTISDSSRESPDDSVRIKEEEDAESDDRSRRDSPPRPSKRKSRPSSPGPMRSSPTVVAPAPALGPAPPKKRRVTVSGASHRVPLDGASRPAQGGLTVNTSALGSESQPLSPVVMGFTIQTSEIDQVRNALSVKQQQKAIIESRRGLPPGAIPPGGPGPGPSNPAPVAARGNEQAASAPNPQQSKPTPTLPPISTVKSPPRIQVPQASSGGSSQPPSAATPTSATTQRAIWQSDPSTSFSMRRAKHQTQQAQGLHPPQLPPPSQTATGGGQQPQASQRPQGLSIRPPSLTTARMRAPVIHSAPPVPGAGFGFPRGSEKEGTAGGMKIPQLIHAAPKPGKERVVEPPVLPRDKDRSLTVSIRKAAQQGVSGGTAPNTPRVRTFGGLLAPGGVPRISNPLPSPSQAPRTPTAFPFPPTPGIGHPPPISATAQHAGTSPEKAAFLGLFSSFYDALTDAQQLKAWLAEQIRKSETLLDQLRRSDAIIEDTVERVVREKVAAASGGNANMRLGGDSNDSEARRELEELRNKVRVLEERLGMSPTGPGGRTTMQPTAPPPTIPSSHHSSTHHKQHLRVPSPLGSSTNPRPAPHQSPHSHGHSQHAASSPLSSVRNGSHSNSPSPSERERERERERDRERVIPTSSERERDSRGTMLSPPQHRREASNVNGTNGSRRSRSPQPMDIDSSPRKKRVISVLSPSPA